jgi:chitinase
VAVSFGGPHGKSLAEAIENVDELKQAYRNVIDAYGLCRIDFDFPAHALDNQQAIERNWQAVAELQREMSELGAPLEVWVTLPATRQGLGDAALDAIRSAGQNGVNLDGVNLKTEYSDAADPQADRRAGRETIETTVNAYYQLRRTLLPDVNTGEVWVKVGVTPVTGADGAAFGPRDAREVYGFAEKQHLGMVSLWTLNRDAQPQGRGAENAPAAQPTEAEGFDISKIFSEFGKLFPQ